jgi:hypothetical protein
MRQSLTELSTVATEWDAQFSTIQLPSKAWQFDTDGVHQHSETIPITQADRTRLFNKINAPGHYLEKLSPWLQASALSEHVRRGDFGPSPLLVLRNGAFATIARGELQTLPNSDVIRSVIEGVGTESDGLFVTRIGKGAEILDVDLVSPSKEVAVRSGDIVQSGLHIVHERFGKQATLIEAFTYRLVCTNGMTRRECSGDGQSRTRKLPMDFPNRRELQMDQIRRLARQTWNSLQAQLDALQATSRRTTRVEELLTRWLQRARISPRNMMSRLLAAWQQEGEENTQFGAVNALTRVATHDRELSERQRRVLAQLAGLLAFSQVHICDRCFSVLARPAAEVG